MRVFFFFLFLAASSLAFADEGGSPSGFWMTPDGEGVVEMYPCDEGLCGRFAWIQEDSAENPSLDDKNPDPALRRRPLCGMTFMGGFEKNGAFYDGGWIYSPRHGGRFSGRLRLLDADHMELRGYMLLSILGQSQVWRRVPAPEPCQGRARRRER